MTQSSVAVSVSGRDWVILNASPDIRAQLTGCKSFDPPGLRGSPIRAVVVTNADIDHVAGLLTLRESTPFALYASAETHAVLAANPVFGVLDAELVERRDIAPEAAFSPLPGLEVTAFAVPGKVALYLEASEGAGRRTGGQTVGLRIADGQSVAYYIPGCADLPEPLLARLADADLLFFDGTVWRDDEMQATGTGRKTGSRMGHVAISGPDGSLARLAPLTRCRKVYIHINNTNPILQPAGSERAAVAAAGWEIAADGQEVRL
jgi:pyrroloquinoline quinone biosynthesis protein B